jgi:tripartite motif-containing protein 71
MRTSGPGRLARERSHWRMLIALCAALTAILTLGSAANSLVADANVAPTPTPKSTVPNPFVDGAAGSYAWGAATEPDGTVIIGDIWNRRVLHYDTSGNLLVSAAAPNGVLFQQGNGDAPYGLAVDERNPVNVGGQLLGTVYVARQFAAGVERWVPNPTTGVYTMAGLLHATGMQYPSRVAVADDGEVYIADMLASKVFVFNGDTQQLEFSFGAHGRAPGQFIQPRGIVIDAAQHVFVMDSGNWRVQVFDKSGNYLTSWGSDGTGPGDFHGENTRGIALDRTRNLLFVSDVSAGTIHEFQLDSNLNGTWVVNIGHTDNKHGFPTPAGTFTQGGRELTIDGLGHLWVGDMPNFRAQIFDYTTNPTKPKVLFTTPYPPQLPPNGAFNDPRGLTYDYLGDLYVADTHNFRIEKFDPNGNWVWSIGTRGRINPDTFAYSRNLAADPTEGYIYIADTYNSAIDKYDTNGNLIWQVAAQGTGNGQFGYPSGVAVDTAHNIYVADSRNQRIQVLEPTAGAYVRQFTCKPYCGDPRGVAVDPATGNIYIADENAAVLEFTNAGTYVTTLATKGTNPGQVSSASDVTLDANFIYVADPVAGHIDLFNLSDGSFAGTFGYPGGRKVGQMANPSAVAVNPITGWVGVAEEFNDRVSTWCIVSC